MRSAILSRTLLTQAEGYTFKNSASFKHPERVYNVIPGDFTQDGKLDLLVYSQSAKMSELSVDLYPALPAGGFGESCPYLLCVPVVPYLVDMNRISSPTSGLAQPIPMDMNGDLKIDLFGIPSPQDSSSPFKIWQNVWNNSNPHSDVFSMYVAAPSHETACLTQKLYSTNPKFDGSHCTLANPHSNAAVDLNGDCLAGWSRQLVFDLEALPIQ